MKKKTVFLIALATISITSCTLMPGSDQWKIRLAATNYVQGKLNAGEKMVWGYVDRKLSREVNGRECKCAEVKYRIKSSNGELVSSNMFKTVLRTEFKYDGLCVLG